MFMESIDDEGTDLGYIFGIKFKPLSKDNLSIFEKIRLFCKKFQGGEFSQFAKSIVKKGIRFVRRLLR